MSAHTKVLPINDVCYIEVIFGLPRKKTLVYRVPNTNKCKAKLTHLLESFKDPSEKFLTPWSKAIPWESLAQDRIKKYKKQALSCVALACEKDFLKKI